MAKRNLANGDKDKHMRQKKQKAQTEPVHNQPNLHQRITADVHLLHRTVGNAAMPGTLRGDLPQKQTTEGQQTLEKDIQTITNREIVGKQHELVLNDTHNLTPSMIQRVVGDEFDLPAAASFARPQKEKKPTNQNAGSSVPQVGAVPQTADPAVEAIKQAYKTSGIMVRKLYSWQKEMPFLMSQDEYRNAKQIERILEKPTGILQADDLLTALVEKTDQERDASWYRSVAMMKSTVAQGPYTGGLWKPPEDQQGTTSTTALKNSTVAPGLVMSPVADDVTFAEFHNTDAGTRPVDRGRHRQPLNKQETISNWEGTARRDELKDMLGSHSPYNEVMAHFSTKDVIAIFVSSEDKSNPQVVQEAKKIQQFMKDYLNKPLPIVVIDAEGVAEKNAPTIKDFKS